MGRGVRLLATAAVCVLLWALAGCATQTRALLAAPPHDLPARVELTDTPFIPQTALRCGPAALATALGAIGERVSPEVLADEVFLPARGGSLQTEMVAGARRHGAVATRLPARMDALLHELAAGHPVIVLQNLGLSFAPVWHYAVVVGYDLDHAEVLLRSGVQARERLTLRTFEHTWARSGSWGVVLTRPGDWPATATSQTALEAAIGFERQATSAHALRVYESALQRWPEPLALAIGLGGAAHASGDTRRAAQVFEAAARQHDSAAAWVNLALMQVELGEMDRAEAAARHAEHDPAWGGNAREVLAMLSGPQAADQPKRSMPRR